MRNEVAIVYITAISSKTDTGNRGTLETEGQIFGMCVNFTLLTLLNTDYLFTGN